MAQRNIQEHISKPGFEADDESFSIFAAFRAVLGGVQDGRMHAKMKSLIVQRGDCIADHLIG